MRSGRTLLLLTLVVFGASIARAGAQQLKQQVVGIWVVESVTNQSGNKKVQNFGPHPLGYWIFTPGGHFMETMLRPGIPKFAANNRIKGTAQEDQSVVRGSIASFGTYTVNSADHTLTRHFLGSTFPNWTGTDHKDMVAVSGDQLTLTTPGAPAGGTGTVILKHIE